MNPYHSKDGKRLYITSNSPTKNPLLKKLILLIISSFFIDIAITQTNAIKITNVNTNKEKILKKIKE